MKKILAAASFLMIMLTGCIKNNPVTTNVSKAEFDAATWNANSIGVTYPILTRVPIYGAAGGGVSLTRTLGLFQIRVNLLGAQKTIPTTFNYTVVSGETTAAAGVHYTALPGTGTIPANTSFGFIDIVLLNPFVSSTTPVILVLEIVSNDIVAANTNYAKVGFSISQL